MGRIVESARPPVPPITDEGAVINWFIEHDKHLNGLRSNFPDRIAAVAIDIQGVLNETSSGQSLRATVAKISTFFTNFTPQEIALYQRGAPFSDDEWSFLFTCELAGAKMRILGYFLEKKYGIDPQLIDQPSESSSVADSHSVPRSAQPAVAIDSTSDLQPRTNTAATVGLWLGIASVFLWDWIGFLPIAGIIASGIGLSKASSVGGVGRTKAAIGLALSILYLLLYVVRRS